MEQYKGAASQLRTRIGRLDVREAGSISHKWQPRGPSRVI